MLMWSLVICAYFQISLATHGVSPARAALYQLNASAAATTFTCDAAKLTITHDRVNDDYCDCKDGSDEPGTAACSHIISSHFFCTDTRITRHIPTSMVNDGVCDCCDGSDEMDALHICTKSTCDEELRRQREDTRQQAETHENGATASQQVRPGGTSPNGARAAFVDYKQRGRAKYTKDLQDKEAELVEVRGYIQQSIQKLQSSGRAINPANPTAGVDPRALQFYQMVNNHIDAVKYHSSMLEKLEETDLGGRLQYFPLLSQCFRSPIINEKRLKGGTPNVVPQLYQFELCPYKHVTQFEINHTFWEKNEKLAKNGEPLLHELDKKKLEELGIGKSLLPTTNDKSANGGNSATKGNQKVAVEVDSTGGVVGRVLSFFGLWGEEKNSEVMVNQLNDEQDHQDEQDEQDGDNITGNAKAKVTPASTTAEVVKVKVNEEGPSTLVGVYTGWNRTSGHAAGGQMMKFDEGHPCEPGIGLDGPTKRSMRVWFSCGPLNRVVKVEENGYCTYDMYFETVHACSHRKGRQLRTTLKEDRRNKPVKKRRTKKTQEKSKTKKRRTKRSFNTGK